MRRTPLRGTRKHGSPSGISQMLDHRITPGPDQKPAVDALFEKLAGHPPGQRAFSRRQIDGLTPAPSGHSLAGLIAAVLLDRAF
jgi:hypothetical protein